MIIKRHDQGVCAVRRIVPPLDVILLRFENQLVIFLAREVLPGGKLLNESIIWRDEQQMSFNQLSDVEPRFGHAIGVLTIARQALGVKLEALLGAEHVRHTLTHSPGVEDEVAVLIAPV